MDFNKKQNYFIFFNYCSSTERMYGDLIVFMYIYIFMYLFPLIIISFFFIF